MELIFLIFNNWQAGDLYMIKPGLYIERPATKTAKAEIHGKEGWLSATRWEKGEEMVLFRAIDAFRLAWRYDDCLV